MKDPYLGTPILREITNLPSSGLGGEIRGSGHINKCLEF